MSELMTVEEARKLSVEELASEGWRLEDEAVELLARSRDATRRAEWIQVLLGSKVEGVTQRIALEELRKASQRKKI